MDLDDVFLPDLSARVIGGFGCVCKTFLYKIMVLGITKFLDCLYSVHNFI